MLKVSWQTFSNSPDKDANNEQLGTCLKQMEKKKKNSVNKEKISSMEYKNNVKNNVEILDLKNANNLNSKVLLDKQGPTA